MKKDKLFIDTGAWIALLVTEDRFHERASTFFRSLESSIKRVSSSHVIAETYTWLRYRTGFSNAIRFLEVIKKSQANGTLEMMMGQQDILEMAEQLLRDFSDQNLSYVDAISMSMMKTGGIDKVFGFDHDFYIMGFEVLPHDRGMGKGTTP